MNIHTPINVVVTAMQDVKKCDYSKVFHLKHAQVDFLKWKCCYDEQEQYPRSKNSTHKGRTVPTKEEQYQRRKNSTNRENVVINVLEDLYLVNPGFVLSKILPKIRSKMQQIANFSHMNSNKHYCLSPLCANYF